MTEVVEPEEEEEEVPHSDILATQICTWPLVSEMEPWAKVTARVSYYMLG
jgi:hypothetical protein